MGATDPMRRREKDAKPRGSWRLSKEGNDDLQVDGDPVGEYKEYEEPVVSHSRVARAEGRLPPRTSSRTKVRGSSPGRRRRSSAERLKQSPGIVRRLANHALQELHEGLDGERWRVNEGWMVPGSSVSSWHGVHVESGRLTGLNLLCNGLAGELPASLGDLVTLRELNLSYNHEITGKIPPSIGQLENLHVLHLYSCSLEGHIPDAICKLVSLEELWLNGNRLTGTIPAGLGRLTALRELYLNSNELTGPLPHSFSSLVNLEGLNLGYNKLSGPFPPALGNMVSLRLMVLEGNAIDEMPPADHGRHLARFLATKRAQHVAAMQHELSYKRRESRDRDAAYLQLQQELQEARNRVQQLEESRSSVISSSSEAGGRLRSDGVGGGRRASGGYGGNDGEGAAAGRGGVSSAAASVVSAGAMAAGFSSDCGGPGASSVLNNSAKSSGRMSWLSSKLFVSPRRAQSVGEFPVPLSTLTNGNGNPYDDTGPDSSSPGKRSRRRSSEGGLSLSGGGGGGGSRFFPSRRHSGSATLEHQREMVAEWLAGDDGQSVHGGGSSGAGTDLSAANTPTAALTPIGRRAPSLLDVLRGEAGPVYTLKRLHAFARSMLLEENLDFWLAIQALREVGDQRLPEEAERLCATFVAPTAPHQVNLSSAVREETEATVTALLAAVRGGNAAATSAADDEMRDAFDRAQRQIFDLLRSDAHPRFVSSIHKELRRFAEGTPLPEDDPELVKSCLAARQLAAAAAVVTPSSLAAAAAASPASGTTVALPVRRLPASAVPPASQRLVGHAPRTGRPISFLTAGAVEPSKEVKPKAAAAAAAAAEGVADEVRSAAEV